MREPTEPAEIVLTIGHSPDPDDAFMWWPLGDASADPPVEPRIDTGPFRFVPVAEDIEALNRRAIERGDLDVTACSMHAYAHIAGRYRLTACGSSMGDGYGPKLLTAEPPPVGDGPDADPREFLTRPGVTVAIPGEHTSAFLTLQLLTGSSPEAPTIRRRVMHFADIPRAVAAREVEVGLVIHEAQVTFADQGLHLLADLGAWWKSETGLPLPLGGNAVRRDLDERFGVGTTGRLAGVLRASLDAALADRPAAMAHAMRFAQAGATPEQADHFVDLYVNRLTLDAGERGRRAVETLLARAHAAGLCPDPGPIDFAGSEPP